MGDDILELSPHIILDQENPNTSILTQPEPPICSEIYNQQIQG